MNRSAILASGVLVSLGFFLQACSSSDGSPPPEDMGGGTGETGGFSYGGLGGGGTPVGGSNPGGGVSGSGFGGSGFAGTTGVAGAGQGGAGQGGATVGGGGASGAGAGGQGAGGLGAGGATAVAKPPCITNGATQGAILGDSYVTGAGSPPMQPELAKVQPVTGQFKNYAVAGTSLASGGILGFIPPQLDSALAASKTLKLVIMDGGGNDILICNQAMYPGCNTKCNTTGSSTVKICQDIAAAAIDTAKTMMKKAADAGVKDVVFFYYPHIPSNNGGYSEILDYAEPLAKASCDAGMTNTGGKLACHWVSLVQAFIAAGGDKNPANFAGDGIHPSAIGQGIIAGEISKVMKANNLGLASGECTP
jgi:lysophospholipase L1-like esterase